MQSIKKLTTVSISFKESINIDYKLTLKELSKCTANLNDPIIRVKVIQWIRKLTSIKINENSKFPQNNNLLNYLQYLNIIIKSGFSNLLPPFDVPPHDGDLVPLEEVLVNNMAAQIPELPRAGPIQPVLCHKSEDGRATIEVKKSPEGGVFCYMAVTPDKLKKIDDDCD